ncbi:MAG: cysteine synthase A [Ruminococcaceae bacterium]|nr:cysteine synthase A [Oscillospiraceae bacterium]
MSKVYNSVTQLIGNTPLMELCKIKKDYSLLGNIFAKLEFFNPAGSVKDRVALSMIQDAEQQGILQKGGTVIEATSGNTGIGLAAVCTAKGYKCIIVMPDTMSIERRKLIASFGAEIILTDGKDGMSGAVKKAEELKKQIKGSIIAGQFYNPSNPKAHYETTGPEIYRDLEGKVDILVCGVGSGGTISGTGKFLKEQNPNIKVIAVEPQSSPLLSQNVSGPHKIQGIGANFVPENLDKGIYDQVKTVSDESAFEFAKAVCKLEGISVGISSGAALCAAVELAKQSENRDKNIVVIMPDTASRYLSTELF